jgi:hypothetical protein
MGYMILKYRINAIEGVHSMLNHDNIERIIENHWGLIKNSFGSLFLSGKWP